MPKAIKPAVKPAPKWAWPLMVLGAAAVAASVAFVVIELLLGAI